MQGPFKYKIKINNGRIVTKGTFKFPVTVKNPKIYVLSKNYDVIYVGVTSQPIRSRLRMGENHYKKPKNGYSGYKWLIENGIFDISIWICDEVEENESKQYIETIEAEIAYLIRKNNKQWPKYQNEIHFHESTKEQRLCADTIFKSIKKKDDNYKFDFY
jgi:hypothetical protein